MTIPTKTEIENIKQYMQGLREKCQLQLQPKSKSKIKREEIRRLQSLSTALTTWHSELNVIAAPFNDNPNQTLSFETCMAYQDYSKWYDRNKKKLNIIPGLLEKLPFIDERDEVALDKALRSALEAENSLSKKENIEQSYEDIARMSAEDFMNTYLCCPKTGNLMRSPITFIDPANKKMYGKTYDIENCSRDELKDMEYVSNTRIKALIDNFEACWGFDEDNIENITSPLAIADPFECSISLDKIRYPVLFIYSNPDGSYGGSCYDDQEDITHKEDPSTTNLVIKKIFDKSFSEILIHWPDYAQRIPFVAPEEIKKLESPEAHSPESKAPLYPNLHFSHDNSPGSSPRSPSFFQSPPQSSKGFVWNVLSYFKEEVEKLLICSYSGELLKDPVVAPDGKLYSLYPLADFLADNSVNSKDDKNDECMVEGTKDFVINTILSAEKSLEFKLSVFNESLKFFLSPVTKQIYRLTNEITLHESISIFMKELQNIENLYAGERYEEADEAATRLMTSAFIFDANDDLGQSIEAIRQATINVFPNIDMTEAVENEKYSPVIYSSLMDFRNL